MTDSDFSPSIEIFTMIPSSKSKINVKYYVAHSLSYNILKFGRKSSINNRDADKRKTANCDLEK